MDDFVVEVYRERCVGQDLGLSKLDQSSSSNCIDLQSVCGTWLGDSWNDALWLCNADPGTFEGESAAILSLK